MGPTASGKTQLALKLANLYPVEIISVDSALIYKDMDIGTAKPDKTTLVKYPHHLVDICDPSERYSAANFCNAVHQLVPEIISNNKIPLLVGGTMMYYNALFKGLAPLPNASPEIRAHLDNILATKGSVYLHQQLVLVDPKAAQLIHPNDTQRIQRALEVYKLTGQSMSELWEVEEDLPAYDFIKLALAPEDRSLLHKRIELRFDTMIQMGFLDEVRHLMQRGDLSLDLPSMRCVGYRQAWLHLQDEYDRNTMRDKALAATRQLAKRQLTWLRSFENVNWNPSINDIKKYLST